MYVEQADFTIPKELMPNIEELPGTLGEIAEIVGVENTIKLAIEFRSCSIYICNVDKLLREVRNKHIKAGYTEGNTVTHLAKKFHLSIRQVRRILSSPD